MLISIATCGDLSMENGDLSMQKCDLTTKHIPKKLIWPLNPKHVDMTTKNSDLTTQKCDETPTKYGFNHRSSKMWRPKSEAKYSLRRRLEPLLDDFSPAKMMIQVLFKYAKIWVRQWSCSPWPFLWQICWWTQKDWDARALDWKISSPRP